MRTVLLTLSFLVLGFSAPSAASSALPNPLAAGYDAPAYASLSLDVADKSGPICIPFLGCF